MNKKDFLSLQEKDIFEQSLLSILIQLTKFKNIEGENIALLKNILQSLTGHFISFVKIKKIIENPLPLRESAYLLKKYLNESEKINLLIALFSIAYQDNSFFLITSNLQIIQFVDLMQIDIDIYEQLLDIIEKKSNKIVLKNSSFLTNRSSLFKNIISFGNNENDDIFFKSTKNMRTCFLINSSFLFKISIENFNGGQHETLLLLNDKEKFSIFSECKMEVSKAELEIIFHSIINNEKQQIKEFSTDKKILVLDKGNLYTERKHNFFISRKSKQRRLAINEEIKKNIYGMDILLHKYKKNNILTQDVNIFIEPYLNFLKTSNTKTEKSILQISQIKNQVKIKSLLENQKILINDNHLIEEVDFYFSKDVLIYKHISFKINHYFEIQKIEYNISEISVNDLYHEFDNGKTIGLNEITFTINRGEFLSIMGPSGSGKTTLLKTLLGEIVPTRSEIKINNFDYFKNFSFFQKLIAYVPQDDLLFSNLTVYENLYYSLKLRVPQIKAKSEINNRISNILKLVDLYEKKHLQVGDSLKKTLSGGQRKRLNIALELISNPSIIILDEPTSGLSSKDTEKLIEFLTELKNQGKIIISTIHQPNADTFRHFDRLLFLDKMGTQVYFGNAKKVFSYFDDELEQVTFKKEEIHLRKELLMPEYLFDMLEYSPQTSDQIKPTNESRLFSPEYWKNKFYQNFLLKMMSKNQIDKEEKQSTKIKNINKKNYSLDFPQFYSLFSRNMKNKFKNKSNLIVTFGASPFLALVIAFILRFYVDDYSFYQNDNIFIYIFISIIVFIFFGLSNSLDDILGEKRNFLREKKIGITPFNFLLSKLLTLTVFLFFQSFLYHIVASIILQSRGMFFSYLSYFFLSGIFGASIGLLISSLLNDRKAMINILPIVLIPQIMFSGAVILFDQMNPDFTLIKKNNIPEICQMIPSRWLLEGLVVSQSENNFYDRNLSHRNAKIQIAIQQKDLEKKMRLRNDLQNFLSSYNSKDYRNEKIQEAVTLQTGKSLNRKKNFFLSAKKRIFGFEIKTDIWDVFIIALMNLILNILTFFQLKRMK